MAGTLKYYVARCAQVRYPNGTKFETKVASHVEGNKKVMKNMTTKIHTFRQVDISKDGSFDLHEDDVMVMESMGFKCIPWNERGTIDVKTAAGEAKADNEAAGKEARRDEAERQKQATADRRAKEKADREAKNKADLDAQKKLAEAKTSGPKASGNRKPAPTVGKE